MNCKDYQYQLADFAARRLPTDEQEAIAEHLRECSACAAQSASFSAAFERIATDAPAAPPDAYWNNFLPRVHERLAQRHDSEFVVFAWLQKLALPAGVVILVLSMTQFFGRISNTVPGDLTSIVQQLPADDVSKIQDAQAADNFFEPVLATEAPANDPVDDQQSLVEMFKDVGPVYAVSGYVSSLPVDSLNQPELQNLLATLDQASYIK
ncbi:MAG TPA: zf-HC2 domain-containing protein [Bacteroidota bacterium]|nr:zf-HC2 domain-containing protein [Bacteroidota bacterium]